MGLTQHINQLTPHQAELIKLPSPEADFWSLMRSYLAFSRLDLKHFDLVISTKYPAWMVDHPNHCCYLQHKLRGLYDTYPAHLPKTLAHPALKGLLALLSGPPGDRERLEPLFSELFELETRDDLPAELFAFPGPLARTLVHYLDAIALAPSAIRRYAAISRTVAKRPDYFPSGVPVEVIYHPSDLPRFENRGYDYIFTASRLDGAKRLDLIIRAFRGLRTEIELRIAGEGPDEGRLRELAAGDPRICFLGRITDEELIRQYAGALFVPFVPYQEDYGLVTIEAMLSHKAVLTTHDAGGVAEWVEPGVTGLIVAPEPTALTQAMEALVADRAATIAMGEAGFEKARALSWRSTVEALLAPAPSKAPLRSPRRPRLTVALDYPVHPAVSGGRKRVYHFYKALARRADVTLLTLGAPDEPRCRLTLAPGLNEWRIPRSHRHLALERQFEARLGASVGDIVTLLYYRESPELLPALRQAAEESDLVIVSHCYLYPAVREVYTGPLWYDAHNVEWDMKCAVLGDHPEAAEYLDRVKETEAACCRDSLVVLACSEDNRDRLIELYEVEPGKIRLAPNGVDPHALPFVPFAERRALRERLGLDGRLPVLFMGSWHQPNIEAGVGLLALARACPELDFFVLGSVCYHALWEGRPENVHLFGVVEEEVKNVLLGIAHAGLNPVVSGSGTNLKTVEYAAAGVPVLTTPFGNRGLGLVDGEEIWEAPLESFAEALQRLSRATDEAELIRRTTRAAERTRRAFDWQTIADRIPLPEKAPLPAGARLSSTVTA